MLTSRTTSNASTPGTAASLSAAARKSASSGDAGAWRRSKETVWRKRVPVKAAIAGRAYTVRSCRKFSRSRTTSPPSWPASATACSARCASGSHCTIRLRGNQLTLEGDDTNVAEARAVVDELVELVEGGHEIGPGTVDAVLGAIDQAEDIRDVFEDVVWRHRGTKIAPKTVNQKRYVDAIRSHTITFAIGPAGTGKTYLAMALAVAALSEREVGRIILTRPAVEAGERLGFLPGDLLAKVDPYLRPLYDALYDMLDADRLTCVHGEGRDRGRAARVHARPHAERLVHHPRRGPEHEPRADADVPDPARLRLEGGRHR